MRISLDQWGRAKHQLQALQYSAGSAAYWEKEKELGIRILQQQLARFSNAILSDIQIGGIWRNNVTNTDLLPRKWKVEKST